jgi:AraC-like DNA-binding protein
MLSQRSFRRLCLARDMLADASDLPVSIRDVANEIAMSPFHFIRQFEAVFGATPHQFRIQSRLERAKRLLALSDHSVTEICCEIGFSSLGSFSDLFARRVGASPSAYRRRVRLHVPAPAGMHVSLAPGCLTLMAAAFAISEKHAPPAFDRL